MRGVAIGCLIVVALPSVAQARGSGVRALVAPTRRADAAALRDQAARVTRVLATRVGATVLAVDAEASQEELAILQRAQRLAAAGALDDAAAVFDAALEAAAHAPARLGDSAELVSAHITRAAIALARGESGRADELIERVLRFDPGFALLPSEDSPRMRRAVEDARRRLGPQPELRAADLGASFCDAGTLVVARALSAERAELVRFDDCKATTTAALRLGADDEQLATALLSPAERHRQLATALPPPPPPPPKVIIAEPPPPATPMYHRAWFWTVIGAVAAGSAAAVWATQRDKDTVHVVPHL